MDLDGLARQAANEARAAEDAEALQQHAIARAERDADRRVAELAAAVASRGTATARSAISKTLAVVEDLDGPVDPPKRKRFLWGAGPAQHSPASQRLVEFVPVVAQSHTGYGMTGTYRCLGFGLSDGRWYHGGSAIREQLTFASIDFPVKRVEATAKWSRGYGCVVFGAFDSRWDAPLFTVGGLKLEVVEGWLVVVAAKLDGLLPPDHIEWLSPHHVDR